MDYEIIEYKNDVVCNKTINIVNFIKKYGTEYIFNKEYKWRPIHLASRHGSYDVVKILIDHGVDVNSVYFYINHNNEEHKYKALHIASQFNHYNIVKLLVENGAVINDNDINNNYNITPLWFAFVYENYDIVEYFIKNKADINSPILNSNEKDSSYYIIEACILKKYNLVELLLEHGADTSVVKTNILKNTKESLVDIVLNLNDEKILNLLKYYKAF
jgi:ankyrin repeat protein